MSELSVLRAVPARITKTDEDFTESDARVHRFDPLACSYLYHYGRPLPSGLRVKEHDHVFWQLEVIKSGRIRFSLPRAENAQEKEFVATSNSVVLIPPGRVHRLTYESDTSFLSVKFATNGFDAEEAACLTESPVLAPLSEALELTLERPSFALEHLLACFLRVAFEEPGVGVTSSGDPIVDRVRAVVADAPQFPTSASEVAAMVGLSLGRVSARFREATGMSLKQWLDCERFSAVAKELAQTELSVSDVAAKCGFANLNTFSRFVSRMTGKSPRAFRRQAMAKAERTK